MKPRFRIGWFYQIQHIDWKLRPPEGAYCKALNREAEDILEAWFKIQWSKQDGKQATTQIKEVSKEAKG